MGGALYRGRLYRIFPHIGAGVYSGSPNMGGALCRRTLTDWFFMYGVDRWSTNVVVVNMWF